MPLPPQTPKLPRPVLYAVFSETVLMARALPTAALLAIWFLKNFSPFPLTCPIPEALSLFLTLLMVLFVTLLSRWPSLSFPPSQSCQSTQNTSSQCSHLISPGPTTFTLPCPSSSLEGSLIIHYLIISLSQYVCPQTPGHTGQCSLWVIPLEASSQQGLSEGTRRPSLRHGGTHTTVPTLLKAFLASAWTSKNT